MATKRKPTKIPVFVSAPTDLNKEQQLSFDRIGWLLEKENFDARALGRSDYPTDYPLKEVVMIARRCAGGVILGYSQSIAPVLDIKPGIQLKEGEKAARTGERCQVSNSVEPTGGGHSVFAPVATDGIQGARRFRRHLRSRHLVCVHQSIASWKNLQEGRRTDRLFATKLGGSRSRALPKVGVRR
jgi:hypothetical protein